MNYYTTLKPNRAQSEGKTSPAVNELNPMEDVYCFPWVYVRPFRGSKKLLYEPYGEPPKVCKVMRDWFIHVLDQLEFRDKTGRKRIVDNRRKTKYNRYNVEIV